MLFQGHNVTEQDKLILSNNAVVQNTDNHHLMLYAIAGFNPYPIACPDLGTDKVGVRSHLPPLRTRIKKD